MPTLLEAAAAASISGLVLMLVTASLSAQVRLQAQCDDVAGEVFATRQLEQLVDQSALAAGAGPLRPPPIASLAPDAVVFASDQDGDGVVDSTSSETTAVEARRSSGSTSVRVRLGRQTMTVLDAGDATAALAGIDASGRVATAATARVVSLSIDDPSALPRSMLFSIPARTLP